MTATPVKFATLNFCKRHFSTKVSKKSFLYVSKRGDAILPTFAALVQEGLDIGAPEDVSEFLAAALTLSRERNQHIWQELIDAVRL